MSDPKKKLHIPAPHDEPDATAGVVELGILSSGILAVLMGYWFIIQPAPTPTQHAARAGADNAVVDRLTGEMREQKRVAQSLDELKPSEWSKRLWTDEEIIALVRFGKRATAEAACRARSTQIAADTLSDPMRQELVKAIDRRSESAPLACLSRLYFDEKLPQADLAGAVDGFWKEAEAFQGNARLAWDTLDDFRQTRQRPTSSRFTHWLRLCALNMSYEASPGCQQLLYQIAPQEGTDLVATVHKHLESNPPDQELPVLANALGYLARNGQPSTFRVVETKELPDYNVDVRLAAIFSLCRFVNTSDEALAFAAAEELTKTARFGARAYDKKVLVRWYEGCRAAFGFARDEPGPLLAVWDGNIEDKPDYRLSTEVSEGHCELREGYPVWHCGSRRWTGKGEIDTALQDFFVKTAWVEWLDK